MKNPVYILAMLILVQCSKDTETNSRTTKEESNVTVKNDLTTLKNLSPEVVNLSKEEALKILNDEILNVLNSKDLVNFSTYIHPEKGVLFSMYGYVNATIDKHLSKGDYIKYAPTNIKFTWGKKDGTGDKLVLPIKDYLKDWVFRKDFRKGEYYLNTFKGSGNSLNNLKEIYPGSDFTENYLKGSEEYAGMDWNSLRLVFEEFQGKYYLVAVVNDTWTI